MNPVRKLFHRLRRQPEGFPSPLLGSKSTAPAVAVHYLDPPPERARLPRTFDRDHMQGEAASDGQAAGQHDDREQLPGLERLKYKIRVRLAGTKHAASSHFADAIRWYEHCSARLKHALDAVTEATKKLAEAVEALNKLKPRPTWTALRTLGALVLVAGTIVAAIVNNVSLRAMETLSDDQRLEISIAIAVLGAATGLFIGAQSRVLVDSREEGVPEPARHRAIRHLSVILTVVYLGLLGLLTYAREQGTHAQDLHGAPHISSLWMLAADLLTLVLAVALAAAASEDAPRRLARKAVRLAESVLAAAKAEVRAAEAAKIDAVAALESASRLAVHWLEEELALWGLLHHDHEQARLEAFLRSPRAANNDPVPPMRAISLDDLNEMRTEALTPLCHQLQAADVPHSLRMALLDRLEPPQLTVGTNGGGPS